MKRILVVEDEVALQYLLKDELNDEGFEVSLAANGREALRMLKDYEAKGQVPEIVILDVRMPEMDGLETMGHILKEKFNTKVIIHSAYSQFRDDYLAQVADAYVVKSHDMSILKSRIKDLLEE